MEYWSGAHHSITPWRGGDRYTMKLKYWSMTHSSSWHASQLGYLPRGRRFSSAIQVRASTFFISTWPSRGAFFKELGLDVKLLNTKCDIAVTALLTGDLQASGCVGSASRFIASQNVPVRTVIWLFKKPTFYVVARPDIKSAADLKGKTIGISSFGSDTDLSMKIFAQSGKLDPEKDMKRIVAGSTSTRLQGLKAGSLDATTLSPPFNVYAEQMGLRVLAYVGDFLEFPQSGFTVSDATLKNKRDVIKRLLRGTLRGLQFTLKNRAETVRFIAKDYKLQEPIADKVYTSLLPAMSENGLATDKGLRVMVETLGTAVGKNVDFPPERLVDYSLLKEVQKELGIQ